MARRWPLQPARFPGIRDRERALWDAMGALFDSFCRYAWPLCGVPGNLASLEVTAMAPGDAYEWTPSEQAEFDRAVRWFIDSMVGNARDADAFSDPSTALIDVKNPIYNGKPILPGQLRTSYEVGIGRAVQIVGDDAPELLGARNADAQRELLRIAFRRLSDGARVTIGDVLNGTPDAGESVRDMLQRAMNEGQNPLKTARDLRKRFKEIDGYNWARLARTETSFAQNGAMQAEYQERGYRIPADDVGAAIRLAAYHPNCLLPGTRVAAEGIAGHLRGYYRGPAVELALSNGNRLSVTANHLILTPNGFSRAATLDKGSHVVCATGGEWVGGTDPDDDQVPPFADDMFDAALEAFGVAPAAVPMAAEDIHGDGAFIDGEVDIVATNGLLARAYEPAFIEQFLDLQFEGGTANVVALASGGYLTPMLFALALTTDCRVSRPDHPLSHLGAHVVRDKLLRFLAGTNGNARFDQCAPDDASVETVDLRQVLDALTGPVEVCQVVNIRQFDFAGHVYDLQTFSSLYIANGVLASNCVCGTTVLPDAGYIIPDVAATACQACQAEKSRAEYIVAKLLGVDRIDFSRGA